jgi:hypothetical protein
MAQPKYLKTILHPSMRWLSSGIAGHVNVPFPSDGIGLLMITAEGIIP